MSWAHVKTINSDFTKPIDKLVTTELGKRTDGAGSTGTSTMFSWIKAIYNYVTTTNKSVIKSVQRGAITWTGDASTKTVSFSAVDVTKTFVILNGNVNSNESSGISCYLSAITPTSITVGINCISSTNTKVISWQVIEFY